MDIALIGLPQSGKTCVFKALSFGGGRTVPGKENLAAVKFPDKLLDQLAKFASAKKVTSAEVILRDPPFRYGTGGALAGDLSVLSEADVLIHVVRAFRRDDISHSRNSVEPTRDIIELETELVMRDLGIVGRRIEKLKEKYRLIRDQKIRERVEALGVKIQEDDDRESLLQKEKDYNLARQKIEMALESFYRSANSLVFQLNKRHITRHMSILRCIDRRFETGEIFIKWDESIDENWLILIYIKNNSPDEGIIIEDKSDPEKNLSHEFKPSEIFKASDIMVDSLTQLLSKERSKKH